LTFLPRPSPCGKFHISNDGKRTHNSEFDWVLPFHNPGLAPVGDSSGSYHICLDGNPAYSARFERTFGFYCDLAAVEKEGFFFHIHPNGSPAYTDRWNWCGNFQQQLCVVRNEIGEYYHIKTDGTLIPGGPHSYAGDFREGFAVVRGKDGLCRHIDGEGKYIHDFTFLDLDVFHKGFARARDERGWHFIDCQGHDVLNGQRFLEIEPFYNGQSLVKKLWGQQAVITEKGRIVAMPIQPEEDITNALQELAVSYWGPLAVRLGILVGIHGGKPTLEVDSKALQIIESSWKHLGLLDENGKLTLSGSKIEAGGVWEKRFLFWTGPQLQPWIDAEQRLSSPDVQEVDFFSKISNTPDVARMVHDVINSYAEEDWAGIESILKFEKGSKVVDLGGGRGFLLSNISGSGLEKILIDRPEVLADLKLKDIEILELDIFSDPIPDADVYILSRVLHDWSDENCQRILQKIPQHADLIVIEREGIAQQNGLLSLNMLLVNGGYERSISVWRSLFARCSWNIQSIEPWKNHLVMKLRGDHRNA